MLYPIVNPFGSIHYISKISVPSGYELPRLDDIYCMCYVVLVASFYYSKSTTRLFPILSVFLPHAERNFLKCLLSIFHVRQKFLTNAVLFKWVCQRQPLPCSQRLRFLLTPSFSKRHSKQSLKTVI